MKIANLYCFTILNDLFIGKYYLLVCWFLLVSDSNRGALFSLLPSTTLDSISIRKDGYSPICCD